jgi:hypothetical protein
VAAALGAAALAAAAPRAPQPLRWEEAFPIAAAPDSVHFDASYRDARGVPHRLEVWRDGADFLHRRTDGRIDLYARRSAGELRFRLVDTRRRIVADVSRTNLYRIGVFADATGLSHVLDRPRGAFRVESAKAPAGLEPATAACRWYALLRATAQPARTLVCWSDAWGLPMLIASADGTPQELFRVRSVDRQGDDAARARALPPVPPGYAIVDVDEEIDPAAD